MKQFINGGARFARAHISFIFMLFFSLLLVACGGGGGGGTGQVATPTAPIVCPAGGTAASADQCAKVTGTVDISDGVTVDSLTKNGFATTTTGVTEVPNANTTYLVLGATEVGAKIPLTFSGFTPTSFLNKIGAGMQPFTTYTYVANLNDGLLRSFKIVKTFTTGAATATVCTAPAMANSLGTCINPPAATGYTWSAVKNVWVSDIGVLVTGLNALPADCKTFGDACWDASSASGLIKYFASNTVINGRKIVWAGYIISTPGPANGALNFVAMYADTKSEVYVTNKNVDSVYVTGGFTNAKGSEVGVKFTSPTYGCVEFYFTGNGTNSRSASCS